MQKGPRKGRRRHSRPPTDSAKDNPSYTPGWSATFKKRKRKSPRRSSAPTVQSPISHIGPGHNFFLKVTSPLDATFKQDVTAFTQEIKFFAVLCLKGFTEEDLFNKRYLGAKRVLDDFFTSLVDCIKSDILKLEDTKLQQNTFDYYCQCLKVCLKNHDYMNAYAFYLALNSPDIDRIKTKSYTASLMGDIYSQANPKGHLRIKRAYKRSFKDAFFIFQESNGCYEALTTEISKSSTVPWIVPVYKKADKISQMNDSSATETKLKAKAKLDLLLDIERCVGQLSGFDPLSCEGHFIQISYVEDRKIDKSQEENIEQDELIEQLLKLDLSDEDYPPGSTSCSSSYDSSDTDTDIVLFTPSAPGLLAKMSEPQDDNKDSSNPLQQIRTPRRK